MYQYRYFLLAGLFFLLLKSANAQIVINEYSCANMSLTADNYSKYEDWIELYNAGSSSVNIGGYYLSDRINQPTKWQIPAGTTLAANATILFFADGRNEATGIYYHTNFKLSQTKIPSEQIVLADNSGAIIDQLYITTLQKHHSYGRVPDGSANWRICTTPTPRAANSSTNTFIAYAATPAFSINAGFYNATVSVSISTTEPNSTIRYTLDGTEPTASSSPYIGPINIASTKVLKAASFSNNPSILPGFVQFATYFINVNHTIPVVSIAANQLQTLANGNGGLVPLGSIEYFDMQKTRKTAGYGEFNRHGQDSWANDQRSLDFVMKDEMGYNYALQYPLFNLTQRDEFQRVILRAAGDDNYPAAHHSSNAGSAHLRDAYVENLAKQGGLNLDVRTATKAIVYINGDYWGVYDLREVPDDHDYTNYYYGQDKYHIQYIETWGGTWAEYGGNQALTDWNAFHAYVMGHNMTNPADWDYVTRNLDVKSLADYVIVNSICVTSDWLNYNTGWWRGTDSTGSHKKWGYILWDNDAVFGFYINYTGIPDTSATALPCNVDMPNSLSDPEQHLDLLDKLRENPDFNNYYINRYIDLMNSTFSCDNMLRSLDSISAVIDPEMTMHANRWFGTYSEWRTNLHRLRYFIERRCASISQTLPGCYNLTGPYPVTITENPNGAGILHINSLTLTDFPWTGNFYGNIPILLEAIPDTLNDFQFDHWQSQNFSVPGATSSNTQYNISGPDSLTAYFVQHTVGISENENTISQFSAFPSVFSNQTTLNFSLKETDRVMISITSIDGKNISSSISRVLQAGDYSLPIDFSEKRYSPGMYLVTLSTKSGSQSVRIIYQPQ
ncbi:MAG: CotH kinase family protein [Bacteroidia bacterium]